MLYERSILLLMTGFTVKWDVSYNNTVSWVSPYYDTKRTPICIIVLKIKDILFQMIFDLVILVTAPV
jgi:hypothetical protein